MKYFLVSWVTRYDEYRSLIITAEDSAVARALVRAAYSNATKVRARELLKRQEGDYETGR